MLRIIAVLCFTNLMLDGTSAIFYRSVPWTERPSRERTGSSESSSLGADNPLLVIDASTLNLDGEDDRADSSPRRLARLASSARPLSPESDAVMKDVVGVVNPRGSDEGLGGAEVIALGLRPDYAFKNVASMLKSFLDSRIKKQNKWLGRKAGE